MNFNNLPTLMHQDISLIVKLSCTCKTTNAFLKVLINLLIKVVANKPDFIKNFCVSSFLKVIHLSLSFTYETKKLV